MAKKSSPKKPRRKSNPVLKAQYTSTAFFNTLASQILHPLREQADRTMVKTDFYRLLLKRFRRVPQHNFHRWLLIRTLRDVEVNPNYILEKAGVVHTKVRAEKKKLWVQLDVRMHPSGKTRYHQADSNYFEIILIAWTKKDEPPHVLVNETDWIDISGPLPSFDIPLDKPASITHWLLFVHGLLGKNNKPIGTVEARGIRCMEVGTFDQKDMEYQTEWEAEMKRIADGMVRKEKVKKEGVKAKVVRG